MSRKRILIDLGIVAFVTFILNCIGYYYTGMFSFYFLNIIIGTFLSFCLVGYGMIVFFILSLFSYKIKQPQIQQNLMSLERANELLDLENIVGKMNNEEFSQFLDRDGYGNYNPNKKAILNLLNLIKDKKGFEEKEQIIYKKLANL